MDMFEKYFKELVGGAQQTPWHKSMADVVAARAMLAYPEHRNRTLRYLAKTLYRLGHQGEAYQALKALPPDELEDCAELLKLMEWGAPKYLYTTIEIITKCNLRCPLCTGRDGGGYKPNDQRIMPFKTFQKIFNRVANHTKLLILVGQGETFLHPQIYDILDFVKPFPVHIDTNASLNMDHERIVKSSIATLIFSVDGVDQRTYEQYRVGGHFKKAIENIKATVAAKKKYGCGPEIVFKYIIFRHNEAYLEDARKLASELGVDRFQFNPCNLTASSDAETVKKFVPVGKNAISRIDYVDFDQQVLAANSLVDTPYCLTASTSPFIQIDGTVYPCCAAQRPGFTIEPRTEDEQKEATRWRDEMNILNHPLDTIWNSSAFRDYRLKVLKNRYAMPGCQSCAFPANDLGRLFDGTVMEAPRRSEPSSNILRIKDLRVEADYMAQMLEEGLQKDIDYYRESGALSPEAELLLQQHGQA